MSRTTSGDLVMISMESPRNWMQRLQDPAREAEPPLGGLVGIGGGADDEGMVAEARGIERAHEHVGDAGLHQDPPLERLPRGQRLGGGTAALDGVTVRIPRVAVGAAELAADVGIDRPEPHAGGGRRVEHRTYRKLEEPGAPRTFVQHLQPWLRRLGRRQEVELTAGHSQRAQPQ